MKAQPRIYIANDICPGGTGLAQKQDACSLGVQHPQILRRLGGRMGITYTQVLQKS